MREVHARSAGLGSGVHGLVRSVVGWGVSGIVVLDTPCVFAVQKQAGTTNQAGTSNQPPMWCNAFIMFRGVNWSTHGVHPLADVACQAMIYGRR